MSANPHRRSLLALIGAAPIAAAAGRTAAPGNALGVLRPGFTGDFHRYTFADVCGLDVVLDRAHPLEPVAPDQLTRLAQALDRDTPAAASTPIAEARAIAALATAFPPEIAAYRSFAPHLRRRLYAELLTRESERLAHASEPPTPPASPGPGA